MCSSYSPIGETVCDSVVFNFISLIASKHILMFIDHLGTLFMKCWFKYSVLLILIVSYFFLVDLNEFFNFSSTKYFVHLTMSLYKSFPTLYFHILNVSFDETSVPCSRYEKRDPCSGSKQACEALTRAAWAAQIQGNKCYHLFYLCMQEAGVLRSWACIRLTSKLTAAAWSPVTQRVPECQREHWAAKGHQAIRASALTICTVGQRWLARWGIGQQDPLSPCLQAAVPGCFPFTKGRYD